MNLLTQFKALDGIRWSSLVRLCLLLTAHHGVTKKHAPRTIRTHQIPCTLFIHVFVGVLESFKYAILDLFSPPIADPLDLVLCLIQVVTSLILANKAVKGYRSITLPVSYLPAICRIVFTPISYIFQSPIYNKQSIIFLDGFLITGILLECVIPDSVGYKQRWTISKVGGFLICCFQAGYVPGGYQKGIEWVIGFAGLTILSSVITGFVFGFEFPKELKRFSPVYLYLKR